MSLAEQIAGLARLTLSDPKAAARQILSLNLAPEISWMALVLSGVASALLTGLTDLILPPQPITLENGEVLQPMSLPPLVWGVVSFAAAAALTIALYRVGRAMGGAASFPQILALMAWLQIFMVLVLIAQLLCLLLVPVLAFLAVLGGLIVSFRAMGHFVREAHGFEGMGQAVGAIVLSFVAVSLVLVLLMAFTGFQPIQGLQ